MRKLALTVFLALSLAACNGAADGGSAEVDLENDAQRASYAQGYRIGAQGQDLPVEIDAFVAGVRDGLEGTAQLDEAELQAAMESFGRILSEATAAAAEERAAEGEANAAAGEELLAENARRPEVVVTDSGLQYEVLEEGDGPRPTAQDTVTVHYRGTLIDGTEFDSSYERGEPTTFPLGGVIPGWTEGLQLMPVGSRYKFWIPGDLAYGANAPQAIGPNQTLIFEVELLEIAS